MELELKQLRAQSVEDRETIETMEYAADFFTDNIRDLKELQVQLSNDAETAQEESKVSAQKLVSKTKELGLVLKSRGEIRTELASRIEAHNKTSMDLASKTESHDIMSSELAESKTKLHIVRYLLAYVSAIRLDALSLAHPLSTEKRDSHGKRNKTVHRGSITIDLPLRMLKANGTTTHLIASNYGIDVANYLGEVGLDNLYRLNRSNKTKMLLNDRGELASRLIHDCDNSDVKRCIVVETELKDLRQELKDSLGEVEGERAWEAHDEVRAKLSDVGDILRRHRQSERDAMRQPLS